MNLCLYGQKIPLRFDAKKSKTKNKKRLRLILIVIIYLKIFKIYYIFKLVKAEEPNLNSLQRSGLQDAYIYAYKVGKCIL